MTTKCPLCDPNSPEENIQICAIHQAELCTGIDMKKAILDSCIEAYVQTVVQHHPLTRALDYLERGY